MKITYENKWERSLIHADLEIPYKEGYQMKMLAGNDIKSLLKVTGSGRDGYSRYTFHTEGVLSMEKTYEREEMKKADIERFLTQLMSVIREVEGYLLDPDHILLSPEWIFMKGGTYYFCYLPRKEPEEGRSLCAAFHEMTEYFIRRLDHRDTEGIFLVYKLHKETFGEGYEIAKILEEYRTEAAERKTKKKRQKEKERERRQGALSEGAVFRADEEDDIEEKIPRDNKKVMRKIRIGKWGQWDDLITEMDGQRPKRHI